MKHIVFESVQQRKIIPIIYFLINLPPPQLILQVAYQCLVTPISTPFICDFLIFYLCLVYLASFFHLFINSTICLY